MTCVTGFYLCILNTRRSFHLRLSTNSMWKCWHKYIIDTNTNTCTQPNVMMLHDGTNTFQKTCRCSPLDFTQCQNSHPALWIVTQFNSTQWAQHIQFCANNKTDSIHWQLANNFQYLYTSEHIPTYVTMCLDVLINCLNFNFIQFPIGSILKADSAVRTSGWCTLIKFHAFCKVN